MDLINKEDKNT